MTSKLPRAVAWRHTLDNTEGIKGNRPLVVLTASRRNPFGKPGEDYSASCPVTSTRLYTEAQMQAAYDAGMERAAEICLEGMYCSQNESADAIRAEIKGE